MKTKYHEQEAHILGIGRHRIGIDGKGVTTLVAFHGCTLYCQYCLNPQCHDPHYLCRMMTPYELCDELMVDDLYFQATDGGVCFGGGEPLLHSDFINAFRQVAPKAWHITLETSLHVDRQKVETILPCVNHFMVDIKDTSPSIYHRYTCGDVNQAIDNLRWLIQQGVADRITVRLPLIPNYNTKYDVARSHELLETMGITHIEEFEYIEKK